MKDDAIFDWREYLVNGEEYGDLEQSLSYWKILAPKSTKSSIEKEEPEQDPEPEDENLKLVEFYGTLLYEKMSLFPKIGKMPIDAEFEYDRFGTTDIYYIKIEIAHDFKNTSSKDILETISELDLLSDEHNNISITIDSCLKVEIKINAISLKTLKSAAKASAKFNL